MKSETGVQRNRQQEYSVFGNNNAAKSETRVQQQGRYYNKMAAHCAPDADIATRKRMRKQFSEEYYDKDKK